MSLVGMMNEDLYIFTFTEGTIFTHSESFLWGSVLFSPGYIVCLLDVYGIGTKMGESKP